MLDRTVPLKTKMVKRMEKQHVSILGVNFYKSTMDEMTKLLTNSMEEKRKAFVVTANPEIVMYAREDDEYKKLLDQASYIVPDGIGVVKAAQILGDPLPERVPGYDLMHQLLINANNNNKRLYMLGAQQEVIEKAVDTVKTDYPKIDLVGWHNGFFDWEDDTLSKQIKELEPDLILVALGVPRQERWIATHYDQFDKGVFIGVGGSFDVLAGTMQRAPEIWQKLNVEWLYRLMKQPSRWRRMLALPHFALKVFGQKLKGNVR